MKRMLTITRKGQTTLPAKIRAQLGVDKDGGILQYTFDAEAGQLIITKPLSAAQISEQAARYVKKGTKPVADVSSFYQTRKRKLL